MGQKHAKFKCSQWNDAKSQWVPTYITLVQSGRLLSYNRATRRFIAGVRLSTAYRLFVFGPLCAKLKWTPPVPGQRPDACLLGIPTSSNAFEDPHLMCWFYFDQPQTLVSLLEAILLLLDKRNVPRPKTNVQRPRVKSFSDDNSQPFTSSPTNYLDLTPWYAEGLAGAWCIAGMHVTEPGCFHHHHNSSDSTAVIDMTLCSEALTSTDWGSNCGTQWDTSGVCSAFDADTGNFCTVESHDTSAHHSGFESNTDSAWASYDTSTHSGGSTFESSGGGGSACGSSCGGGGGGGGGTSSCSSSSSSCGSSCGSSCSSS